MKHLGGMDTMFVRAETSTMLLHVAGVLVLNADPLTGPEVRARVCDLVTTRIDAVPPLRWRLVEPPGGIGALRWVEDPSFDVDQHVRLGTIERPGSRADLEQAVAEVAATPLDRTRPLWEMHVVDGMADGSVVVISKFHHAFMDGSAGLNLVAALFDLTPDVDLVQPEERAVPAAIPSPWRLLVDTPGDVLTRLGHLPGAMVSMVAGVGGFVGAMFPGRTSDGNVSMAPRASFNGALSPARTVALADCSLADMRTVKDAFGVTVNDVVLAAVTSSLRTKLVAEDGLGGASLIAAVPVSVRAAHPEEQFGNHTSAMMVPLPVAIDDPVERLHAIHRSTQQAKTRTSAMGPDLLETWAGLIPPWMISAGARLAGRVGLTEHLPPVYNLIVSNVAGPPVPVYLAGFEVTATYPLGPLLAGSGLNISVVSRCDDVHIGVIADPTLVDDPGGLADDIADGIAELLASASLPSASRGGR